LSDIENGKVFARLEVIGRLAKTLEAEPAEFFRPPTPRKR
jgi:hypothetical protein